MKKRIIITILFVVWLIPQISFGAPQVIFTATGKNGKAAVAIIDQGNYFKVMVDYTSGLTHRQIGEALGAGILKAVPNYEALIDSYIAENLTQYEYPEAFFRVDDLKINLDQNYQAEIEGIASKFSGGTKNVRKDNKISRDEFYLYNLFPDIIRGSQCNYIAVFGKRSATHRTMLTRNLDWYGGDSNQLPQLQTVFTYKYPSVQICSIGYLGFLGILTGFNDHKVFSAILDSTIDGTSFSSLGKRSYPLDLRSALESNTTLQGATAFMMDLHKVYAVNHIIVFADPNRSMVLENNFSGQGTTQKQVRRALRSSNSRLNKGITWGIPDAIGSVNSFLLYGNCNNHEMPLNTKRWKSMKRELAAKGPVVTFEELKKVASYNHGSPGTLIDSGDLYNKMTLQIVAFQPDTLTLEISFHPKKSRQSPAKPVFEKVTSF
jgi:hypothetical protein